MSSCASFEEAQSVCTCPFNIKQEDVNDEISYSEVRRSSRGNDQDAPVATIALQWSAAGRYVEHVPASNDDYLTEMKLEESENEDQEEKVEIKIEDDESQEGLEVNSFAAHQYQNRVSGGRQNCDWHSVDEIIALGLKLKKEVKEEENDLSAYEDEPPLEREVEIIENLALLDKHKDFEPAGSGNDRGDAGVVKPLFKSLGANKSLKPPKSMSPEPLQKKRGPKMKQFKKELIALFDSNDKLYHCHCGYKAKYAQTMEYHRAIHTGEKPYECKFCEYKASHPTTLRRHMRRHTGEKPHACKHCDYKAAQPTALINHMRSMHTGERPYICDVCPFRAHDQGSLAGHKLKHLHPDEKPFECEVCGIKMTRRTHLKRHAVRKHPGTNISLDRRFSTTGKNRTVVSIIANTNQSRSKRPFRRRKSLKSFGSTSESSSSQTSDDETSTPVDRRILQISSDDHEYRPDRCVTPPSASNLLDRPRRSIVAPKILDL